MSDMRFGIIGCGVIAFTHAMALKELAAEGCELYACCDIIREKADRFAGEHKVPRVYYDYHELLRDGQVDIVCVCVPSGLHGQVCIDASQAGKAIVCEKPMEITPDRIQEVIAAAEKNRTKMQCIFQRRLMPAAIAARRAVQEGKLGRICLAEAQLKYYRDQAYYDSAGWRGTWEMDGGGALMNQGVHGVDLILWMLGDEVESLSGLVGTLGHQIPVEDTAAILLQMRKGTICVIEGATTAYPGFSTTFGIYGELGSIVFNDEGIIEWKFLEGHDIPRPEAAERVGGAKSAADIGLYGHICLLRDIAEAVREDRRPMIPPEDAELAVKVICAAYESSKKRMPIAFGCREARAEALCEEAEDSRFERRSGI